RKNIQQGPVCCPISDRFLEIPSIDPRRQSSSTPAWDRSVKRTPLYIHNSKSLIGVKPFRPVLHGHGLPQLFHS
ncbi:MAG: hypothetical protein ABI865_14065, partial [Nitrosospira sp.]